MTYSKVIHQFTKLRHSQMLCYKGAPKYTHVHLYSIYQVTVKQERENEHAAIPYNVLAVSST